MLMKGPLKNSKTFVLVCMCVCVCVVKQGGGASLNLHVCSSSSCHHSNRAELS